MFLRCNRRMKDGKDHEFPINASEGVESDIRGPVIRRALGTHSCSRFLLAGMALDDRSGLNHHQPVRDALAAFQFGNTFAGFPNVLLDKIEPELKYVIEQILRFATSRPRKSCPAALVGRREYKSDRQG